MKNNKGFSLVELIVVIAIMAILAAVAVIGVSVYIPKAQQANDKQMISDIQYAITLYASGEVLTPGQSGYVVIRKNGGVAVDGSTEMKKMIEDALKASYGDDYSNELKVAYKEWTGMMDSSTAGAILNSSYAGEPSDLLENMQVLTNALAGYYDQDGTNPNANKDANQAVLDIAYSAVNYIDKQALVNYWKNNTLAVDFGGQFNLYDPSNKPVFNVPAEVVQADDEYILKSSMALAVARTNAFVTFTRCSECNKAYQEGLAAFYSVTTSSEAKDKMGVLTQKLTDHITSCTTCKECYGLVNNPENPSYWTSQAEIDANAYAPMMGQLNDMSDTLSSNEEFSSGNFFTSDYVSNTVNGYISAADAFQTSGAQDGDILIISLVDKDGNLAFQVYPMDYN